MNETTDQRSTAAAAYLDARSPEWLAAVARRSSRRTYDGHHVEPAVLDVIDECCQVFRPRPDARTVLVRDPAVDVFTGVIGAYGKVRDTPHLLAFIADERAPVADQHVGLTGQGVVLEATRLGLDTCWIGGFFSMPKVRHIIDLTDGERVYAVSPLGHAVASKSVTERTMRGLASSDKRKCVEELAPSISDTWPEWAVAAVETARLAPSALNRQPWRFRLEEGGLVLSVDSAFEAPRVAKRLDCGIAMLHVELGAAASGMHGAWTDLTGSDVARFDAREQ